MTTCGRCGKHIEKIVYCQDCQDDDKKIDELTAEGHSPHCSCRLVWGDGCCECGLKKD